MQKLRDGMGFPCRSPRGANLIVPWVTLGAIPVRTDRMRIGTMITPVSRRRPWKLAGETVTVDHLSNGRVILSVGLGALDTGFAEFGEETDRKARAQLLDEGLDIITGLRSGQPFNYDGQHYTIRETTFQPPPPPVQKPRIPVWVVGAWPWPRSMQRAMRYDGILPTGLGADKKWYEMTPDHIREIKAYIEGRRAQKTPYDIVVEGTTPGDDHEQAAETVRPWSDAGATWWIEAMWSAGDLEQIRTRVRQGPPRLADAE
jgi:alkanesulfonate monooxygenase SsuD/methylene tetrahydromethanopterin reductase-like flavin-dependent oxidoreductase (luciferase family)